MGRLALFDLDNTLVDRAAGIRSWASEFCAARGLGPGDVAWLVRADGDGLVPEDAFFADVRARWSLSESVDDLVAGYRRRYRSLVLACRGAADGLVALRAAGWTVGVVTNGAADMQLATLTGSGIADLVDGWAISAAEGIRKPDVRLFEIAARRCGMSLAAGGWMVGDSAVADIGGGRAAGLRTIWIDRGRAWPGQPAGPDHTVTEVANAFAFLLTR